MFKLLAPILLLFLCFFPAYANTQTQPDWDGIRRQLDELDRLNRERAKKAGISLPPSAYVENMSGSTADVKAKTHYTKEILDQATGKTTSKAQDLVSKIKVPASVQKTAKSLGKGVGTNLIAIALYDMLGRAVDYVLDPANNSVIIKDPANPDGYYWKSVVFDDGGRFYPSPQLAAEANCRVYSGCVSVYELRKIDDRTYEVIGQNKDSQKFPAWTVDKTDKKVETVSLDEIAQKIIEMAENQNELAKELLKQIADERVKSGEFDDDIINNATDVDADQMQDDMDALNNPDKQKQAEGETEKDKEKDGETETDKKTSLFELPKFCDWADWFCEDEKERQGEKVAVNELQYKNPSEFDTNYVNFGGACPAMQPFTVMNVTLRFDLTPLCQFAVEVRPAVLAVSYLFALAIVVSAFKI